MVQANRMTFTATVEKFPHKGGWHYVRLAPYILHDIREIAGKNGNVPLIAEVGNTAWQTTAMSMGDQQWFIPVSATVRKAEKITEGDSITVTIAPDFNRLNRP